jgi:hypothetical protein
MQMFLAAWALAVDWTVELDRQIHGTHRSSVSSRIAKTSRTCVHRRTRSSRRAQTRHGSTIIGSAWLRRKNSASYRQASAQAG